MHTFVWIHTVIRLEYVTGTKLLFFVETVYHSLPLLPAPTQILELVTLPGIVSCVLSLLCGGLNLLRGVHAIESILQVAYSLLKQDSQFTLSWFSTDSPEELYWIWQIWVK